MRFSLEYYFYFLSGWYMQLYLIVAIVLLLTTTFLKKNYQTESYNLLYVFNTLLAFFCCINLLFFAGELFVGWYGQDQYEWYAFFGPDTPGAASWKWYIIKLCLSLFCGLLFFFRKLRTKKLLVISFLIVSNVSVLENIYDRFSKDYLPSHWSVSGPIDLSGILVCYLIIVVLLGVIYCIAKKKNKLPYPSAFLKNHVQ